MKRVLITGYDSFTGKHLSSYLAKFSYDLYGTSLFDGGDKIYKCDITKKEDVKKVLDAVKPQFIIHLAGIAFTAHGNSEDFYRVNTIGTLNILDTLIESECKPEKIILASSATVYGNQGVEVLDESLCPKPANHYGASKYTMESLANNYFDRLNIIITRPFNYTGIGQEEHFLIPKIVKHFQEGKRVIELGNLDVSREFNDVEYVCEVYKRLLECKAKSAAVNICSNNGIKLLDIIDTMNNLAGYKIEVKVNPEFVRKDEIRSLTGSTDRLDKMIGKVKQTSLENTLRNMFEA